MRSRCLIKAFILAALTLLLPIGAGAAEISDEYSVGTSNNTIFAGVAEKLPFGTHYVYWRESQYVYAMAYGSDLVYDAGTFTGSSVDIVRYTTSSGYQTAPVYDVGTETDFQLSTANRLVYSDLGHYPDLIERGGVTYAVLACFMLGSFAVWALLDRLVRACKRSK